MTKVVTSCKDCKFALYGGKTQVGCEFDLLDKYEDAGIKVVEAYDDDKEFNVIDRICIYSRHRNNECSKEDVLEAVKIKYQVVVILTGNDTTFPFCLQSLLTQDIKPQHITVVKPYDVKVEPFKYTKQLMRSGIKWRYEDCINPEFDEGALIDATIDQVVFPYYVVIWEDQQLPADFSKKLNNLVNVEMKIFSYLKDNSGIEVVPAIYHKQLGGNAFKLLHDKIVEDKDLRSMMMEVQWS